MFVWCIAPDFAPTNTIIADVGLRLLDGSFVRKADTQNRITNPGRPCYTAPLQAPVIWGASVA